MFSFFGASRLSLAVAGHSFYNPSGPTLTVRTVVLTYSHVTPVLARFELEHLLFPLFSSCLCNSPSDTKLLLTKN